MKFEFTGINIYSKNPEKVFDFYKKLGFRVLEEVPPNNEYYGSTLALSEADNPPLIWIWRQKDNDNSVVRNHLSFSTNGKMDEVYEKIISAGIKCDPPFIAAWGGRELILYDPEGNELLFL